MHTRSRFTKTQFCYVESLTGLRPSLGRRHERSDKFSEQNQVLDFSAIAAIYKCQVAESRAVRGSTGWK